MADLPYTRADVARCLPIVSSLVPASEWITAARHRRATMSVNPFMEWHTVERHAASLALAKIFARWKALGTVHKMSDPFIVAGAALAGQIAEARNRLSEHGRRRFAGMLRDALQNEDHGIGPLQFELSTAIHFQQSGFTVRHHDMETGGGFDLLVSRGGIEAEVECKHFGGDAGLQVHMRDLILLLPRLKPSTRQLESIAGGHLVDIVLWGRLGKNHDRHSEVATAVAEAVKSGTSVVQKWGRVDYRVFTPPPQLHQAGMLGGRAHLRAVLQRETGSAQRTAAAHVAKDAVILVVARSERPDDLLGGVFQTLKQGAGKQLTGSRPGFVLARFAGISNDEIVQVARSQSKSRETAPALQKMASRILERRPKIHTLGFLAGESVTELGGGFSSGGRMYSFVNPSHPFASDPRLAAGDRQPR